MQISPVHYSSLKTSVTLSPTKPSTPVLVSTGFKTENTQPSALKFSGLSNLFNKFQKKREQRIIDYINVFNKQLDEANYKILGNNWPYSKIQIGDQVLGISSYEIAANNAPNSKHFHAFGSPGTFISYSYHASPPYGPLETCSVKEQFGEIDITITNKKVQTSKNSACKSVENFFKRIDIITKNNKPF